LAERQAATWHGSKNKANDGSTAAHDASAQVLKVDMVVLNARLRQRLDGSGVSEVWRARDAKRRMVAFKRLRDNTLPDRDLAEAAYARGVRVMEWLAGRDDRPNTIIRLYAASSDRLAWVSGWCANGNMEDLLALQWHRDKLVTFFMKVCEATAWAHRQGVLHRCIRPANVLLDDELQPTLSDFDLVDLSTVREKAFGDGGYRSYSAPEEIAGQGAQSPTADVYSLGKVLAFLLSGRHCAEPPSNAPQLDELTGAPAGLVRIVRRCCMADPTARYPQVDDLLGALHHYQHGGANAAEQKLKRPMLARKRLSALPAQRRWLQDEPDPKSARKRKPKSEQAPNSKKTAPIAGATVAQRLRAGNFALPGAALLPRRQQLLVAAAGLALVLMAAAGMLLQPVPTDWSVMVTTIIMASGAAGMTMLLPAMQLSNVRRMRLLGGAVAALLVFAVGLQPLVKWRLQRTLVHGSQQQRVAALTALLTRGVRDFPGLEMSGVDLTDIDFSEADLSGAKLNGTNLSGAMLTEADLRGASVVGARIDGADTSESTIVEAQGWTSVHCDGESSMPFGWYCLDGAPANDTTMDKTPADNAPADNPPPTTEGEWLPPAN
ncbi:MAG TPA: hypothetical protein ENK23_06010, partial [Sorangium sp.]|nr:hypothetical protein [Sorangium sp.]